jgi:hypothetical protein
MKCLSLKQPYAELLVSGKKTIELRTWNTNFRGQLLVHASKNIDMNACKRNKVDPTSVTRGAIIGRVFLFNVKSYKNRNSFLQDSDKHLAGTNYKKHMFGFLIKNSKKFKKPIFMPGRLRFFNVHVHYK